ncbi:MAG: hypothetical protein R2715_08330 [Ilumatobacteraceae bacterium]
MPTDEELIAQLDGALAAYEPLPDAALQTAYAAFAMGGLDDLLAELIYDSLAPAGAVLVRGAETEARLLTFRNDSLTVDLTLAADGETVLGEVLPAGPALVTIETRDGTTTEVEIDDFGRFRGAGAGVIRLRVPGLLVTPWISRNGSDET